MASEHVIVHAVRACLESNPRMKNAAQVAVAERGGTVTPRGTVSSLHQRHTAVAIAKSVRGVRKVADELRIDPRDRWQDNQLRGAALQALISKDGVPADRVDARVAAGWLTLTGEVRHQSESNAAFEAVYGLAGVGGFTNKIKVISAGGW
jgi:osmotically-inducible protein OsmY